MLTLDEGRKANEFARLVIEKYVKNEPLPVFDLPESFNEKLGTFITIHTYPNHNLRGCIGIPYPVMPLKDAIVEAAKSATQDPRFNPLSDNELEGIIVEITIMTTPELIEVNDPSEYLKKIRIGKDGLIIKLCGRSGLLLPQVPIEQKWDVEDFITNLCLKAGLPPDAWYEKEVNILSFQGQIFSELTPKGDIEEQT